jgi:tRNA/rRNA methyltransferase
MNPPRPLDKVRIVLSHTSHPGNIGATARAMKTMGLGILYLVNPKFFPDKEAERRAAGAREILDTAVVCASMEEALKGTTLAAAVTARPRDLSHEVFDARQGALEVLVHGRQAPVALVFGNETAGLTMAEASKCQIFVHIPASPEYSSLNLASAVQVMAYELRMSMRLADLAPLSRQANLAATFDDIELLYRHLERLAISSGFLNVKEPRRFEQRVRRLFARARFEKEEVSMLRGLLSALEK